MAIAEVAVIPVGTGTTSVSHYVAQAVRVLKDEKGVKYELTGMGTIIEGELDRLLAVIKKMHQAVLDAGVMRVVTTIKIDDRRDRTASVESKLKSLKRELGR